VARYNGNGAPGLEPEKLSFIRYDIPFFWFATSVLMYQVYEKCWFVLHFEKPLTATLKRSGT